jgi:hypothetical protein
MKKIITFILSCLMMSLAYGQTPTRRRAMDAKKIKDIAMSVPDVDQAKVEKFRKLIDEGNYKVDSKAVAEKMVDDINDSKQKGSDKGLRTTKVKEDPKKIKDKEKSEKQEKDENSTSSWFKRKNKKEIKMVEPFKR